MSEGDQVDELFQGLKLNLRLEVMKSGAQTMNDKMKICLNVDAAFFWSWDAFIWKILWVKFSYAY